MNDGLCSGADKARLLALARAALEARVRRLPPPEPDLHPPFDVACGAFVTIRNGAALRGCLGRITGDVPLGLVIADLARAVADSDPRFPPVTVPELAALSIEISVLTPQRAAAAADIEIGRHGLIVERGTRRGLLLPQVAVEHIWDATTFLRQTCVKAGLPPDAWHDADTRISVFEAQVFAETPAGVIP